MNNELWEILVPCQYNDGKPVRTKHHKQFDKYVQRLSGGITIFAPSKGKWINKTDGQLFEERMIPVRIACTRKDIEKIVDFALKHYKQIAVMAYRISEAVIIKYDKNYSK